MVLQEDAAALVADVLLVLGARGRDVRVTAENQVRLVRLGALMLDAYGVGTEVKEEKTMAEPMIYPVGHVHRDSNGIERVKNQWGFNSFTTADGAKRSALTIRGAIGARPAEWFIWRLADGSYDFTATGEPITPGHPAELAEKIRTGAPAVPRA